MWKSAYHDEKNASYCRPNAGKGRTRMEEYGRPKDYRLVFSKGRDCNFGNQKQIQPIASFLATLKPESRNIFMRRYWLMDSVAEIAEKSGSGLSKVKMSLSRTRECLKLFLEQEGYRL